MQLNREWLQRSMHFSWKYKSWATDVVMGSHKAEISLKMRGVLNCSNLCILQQYDRLKNNLKQHKIITSYLNVCLITGNNYCHVLLIAGQPAVQDPWVYPAFVTGCVYGRHITEGETRHCTLQYSVTNFTCRYTLLVAYWNFCSPNLLSVLINLKITNASKSICTSVLCSSIWTSKHVSWL